MMFRLRRQPFPFGITLGLLITFPVAAQTSATRAAPQFGWHTNLEGAKTAARQTGKPIFLVFRCDP
jgi:hypothetical protein